MSNTITLEATLAPGRPIDLAPFGLPSLPAPSGPNSLFRNAVILKPGVYNGYPFTPADLRSYAKNFDPSTPVPIVLDHRLNDASACYGFVRAMSFEEPSQTLMALLEFLGEYAVERVQDKRWRKLSGRFTVSEVPARKIMTELSVTLNPASQDSVILSKGARGGSLKDWTAFEAGLGKRLQNAASVTLSSIAEDYAAKRQALFAPALEAKMRTQEAHPGFGGAYANLPTAPPTLEAWLDQRTQNLATESRQAKIMAEIKRHLAVKGNKNHG